MIKEQLKHSKAKMALGNDNESLASNGQLHGMPVLKWDPHNIEIRTKSVEMALEPLVTKVE